MPKKGALVIAIGGPKGGASKTTLAVYIALFVARILGLRVLFIDSDRNRSSLDIIEAGGPDIYPFDAAPAIDEAARDAIASVHGHHNFDLVVVDLPGEEESGALRALISRHGRPVVDALFFPTKPDIMDLRPLLRQIDQVVKPLGLPYKLGLVRVHPHPERVALAQSRQKELRDQGYQVADAITRELTAHTDVVEEHTSILDMPGGRRSGVRVAEREYRLLAAEALELVGIDASLLKKGND